MRVFRQLDEIPSSLGVTVISIGNFDGVHCGHKTVLKEVVRRARELQASAVAVTFAKSVETGSSANVVIPLLRFSSASFSGVFTGKLCAPLRM